MNTGTVAAGERFLYSRRVPGRPRLFVTPWATLVLALALISPACRGGATRGPDPFEDKQAALASFEDPDRDTEDDPELVLDKLPLEPRMVVADIGSGSGYFTRRLARRVPEGKVFAIDIDLVFKRHIEKNKAKWGTPNIEPRLALDDHPVLPQDSVDLVFVANTYAYIGNRTRYFRNVHTALKPGGWLAIIDFRTDARCRMLDACPRRARRVAKSTALEELAQAGFTLHHEEQFLPHQYFLVLQKSPSP